MPVLFQDYRRKIHRLFWSDHQSMEFPRRDQDRQSCPNRRGYNYRLDEMRAALGIVQLGKVKAGNTKRREIILTYREKLKNLKSIEIPFLAAPEGSTHHLFPVLLRDGARRADFMTALAGQGIQTSIHYPPIHRFSSYLSLLSCDHRLPLTEEVCSREVTLPLFPHMSQDQVRQVIRAVFRAAGNEKVIIRNHLPTVVYEPESYQRQKHRSGSK